MVSFGVFVSGDEFIYLNSLSLIHAQLCVVIPVSATPSPNQQKLFPAFKLCKKKGSPL